MVNLTEAFQADAHDKYRTLHKMLRSLDVPTTAFRTASIAVAFLLASFVGWAQEEPAYSKAINPYVKHEGSDIDHIDMTNGNLTLDIPLLSYPQRGPDLTMDFHIRYRAPQWFPSVNNVSYPTGYLQLPDQCAGNPTFLSLWQNGNWETPAVLPQGASVVHTQFYTYGYDITSHDTYYNNIANGTIGFLTPTSGWTVDNQAIDSIDGFDITSDDGDDPENPSPIYGPAGTVFCSKTPANITNNVYWVAGSDGAKHYYGTTSDETASSFYLPETEDGSGISIASNGFVDRHGVHYTYTVSGSGSISTTTATDRFGNTITNGTNSNGQTGWTDTVGRFLPNQSSGSETNPGVPTSDLSHCQSGTTSAFIWQVPGAQAAGGTETIYLCYSPIAFQTNFDFPQYNLAGETLLGAEASGTQTLLTEIVLPNLTHYLFTYDPYLCLSSVTLPTGATVSYTYENIELYITTNSNTGVFWPTISRVITSRTVDADDGTGPHTWTYAWQITSNPSSTTGYFSGVSAVTDPLSNAVIHTVSPLASTDYQQQYYQGVSLNSQGFPTGGTLVKTTNVTYTQTGSGIFLDPLNSKANAHSAPKSVVEMWANGQTMAHTYSYVPGSGSSTYYRYGSLVGFAKDGRYVQSLSPQSCACFLTEQLQSESIYDYGANGQPGKVLQTKTYQYMWQDPSKGSTYQTANLLDLPEKVSVFDGNGNLLASTGYAYDETTPVASGLGPSQNLQSPPGPRIGQNTSKCDYLIPTSAVPCSHVPNAAYTLQTYAYYDSGELNIATDARGYMSTTTYAQCEGSVATIVTNAAGQTSTAGYDCNTGKQLSVTDPNNQTTLFTYNDPLARLTQTQYPDTGSTGISYNHDPVPPVVTITVATGEAAGPMVQKVLYDGAGRTLQIQTNSDQAGVDYVDTTYDADGRMQSLTNPYRQTSDPTYGITSYSYDALGRKLYVCHPDNTSSNTTGCVPTGDYASWNYAGNSVLHTDEVGNQWLRTTDALGRLTQVLEPNGIVQTPSMETDYGYDGLNNLLSVTQWGGGVGSVKPRARSFTYDSLSRLITATNPETGTICYGKWSGSLCVNGYDQNSNLNYKTDARGVVAAYTYDSLNRILTKSYSNDPSQTPSTCYQYDTSPLAGQTALLVGRLANQWTQSVSLGACAAALPTTFPTTGFVSAESILQYDPMGRVQKEQQCTPATCTNGTPYALQYTYDLAGNLSSSSNGSTTKPIAFTYTYDGAQRLLTLSSSLIGGVLPGTLFSAQTAPSSLPCSNSVSTPYTASGSLVNAAFGSATVGSGLWLNRGFDRRLRTTCEIDTGSIVANATNGTATVSITGSEQSK